MLKKILKKLTQKVVAGSKNKASKAVWKQNRKPSKNIFKNEQPD